MANPTLRAINAWRPSEGFLWGGSDCCQFTAEVLREIGTPVAIPWAYSSKREAVQILRAHGGLYGALCAVLGPPHTMAPQNGDVALWRCERARGVGIVWASGWLATVMGPGAEPVPVSMAYARHLWRPAGAELSRLVDPAGTGNVQKSASSSRAKT